VVGIAALFLIILLVHPPSPMLQSGTPAPNIALRKYAQQVSSAAQGAVTH